MCRKAFSCSVVRRSLPGGGWATVKIVLPAAWNELMAERGYEPLEHFFLNANVKPDVPRPQPRGYTRPGVRADRPTQPQGNRPAVPQGNRRPRQQNQRRQP